VGAAWTFSVQFIGYQPKIGFQMSSYVYERGFLNLTCYPVAFRKINNICSDLFSLHKAVNREDKRSRR
jgi:hypothetical protein